MKSNTKTFLKSKDDDIRQDLLSRLDNEFLECQSFPNFDKKKYINYMNELYGKTYKLI